MQILTLHSWSNAFDFERLLHTRETQLMIRTASCAVSHWGLAGSTALTQTCAARDRGFLPHFYCLTATMQPQTAISNRIPRHTQKHNLSLESVTSWTQANQTVDCSLSTSSEKRRMSWGFLPYCIDCQERGASATVVKLSQLLEQSRKSSCSFDSEKCTIWNLKNKGIWLLRAGQHIDIILIYKKGIMYIQQVSIGK